MEGIDYNFYANHLQWGTLVVQLMKSYLFLTILLAYQKSNHFNYKYKTGNFSILFSLYSSVLPLVLMYSDEI